jgi:hypothetical protein
MFPRVGTCVARGYAGQEDDGHEKNEKPQNSTHWEILHHRGHREIPLETLEPITFNGSQI